MHENGPMDDIARNQLRVLRVAVRKHMPIWIIDQTYNKADVNRRIPSDSSKIPQQLRNAAVSDSTYYQINRAENIFLDTELYMNMRGRNVGRVVLMGSMADDCIRKTIMGTPAEKEMFKDPEYKWLEHSATGTMPTRGFKIWTCKDLIRARTGHPEDYNFLNTTPGVILFKWV